MAWQGAGAGNRPDFGGSWVSGLGVLGRGLPVFGSAGLWNLGHFGNL